MERICAGKAHNHKRDENIKCSWQRNCRERVFFACIVYHCLVGPRACWFVAVVTDIDNLAEIRLFVKV